MDIEPRFRILLGYLLCLPLLLVFTYVGSAGHDDSHITFWQAWTLNHLGTIVNYNGEAVEQSSSLLHTVLTALLARVIGLEEATAGYLVALASAFLAILYCFRIGERLGTTPGWLPALITSSSIYFSYWACSGMESTLAACCALFMIDQCQQWLRSPDQPRAWLAILSASLLATVRPEMVLIGPAWLVLMAVLTPAFRPWLLQLLLPFLLVSCWRQAYFGAWFPNPVYAKARGSDPGAILEQLLAGLDYLFRLGRHPASAILALITVICLFRVCHGYWTRRRIQDGRPWALMMPWLAWVLLYAGFVVTSGGDWMKEGRFWVPLIPATAIIMATALHQLRQPAQQIAIGLVFVLQLIYGIVFIERFNFGMTWQQQARWESVFPYASFFERSNREHLRDLPAIAELERWVPRLHASLNRPVSVMSKQMGLANYTLGRQWHGQFRIMDMAGLVENSLRHCPPLARDGFERQGMRLNYRKFFERLPEARQTCGLEAPDIIYDIYGWGETTPLPVFLKDQGYHIVFHQTGRVDMKPGSDVTAHEVIAIRADLLRNMRTRTVEIDFNSLYPQ